METDHDIIIAELERNLEYLSTQVTDSKLCGLPCEKSLKSSRDLDQLQNSLENSETRLDNITLRIKNLVNKGHGSYIGVSFLCSLFWR